MKSQNKRHRKVQKYIDGPNHSGQHLLHNKGLIHDLVKMAKVTDKDLVIEIGAGTGFLTLPLAKKSGKVIAVENDPAFVQKLLKKMEQEENIRVVQRDFLQFQLPKTPFCVVSNIPYSITTPIMKKLLSQPTIPLQRAVIVMEYGAAKRFTANPITNPYILKWRMWFEFQLGRSISRKNFSPPPNVDSAVLSIQRKDNPSVSLKHHSLFTALAEFGLKYPQLAINKVLKGVFTPPQIKRLVQATGLDQDAPICSLSEYQWGIVFNTMMQHVPPFRWPKIRRR
ncbi:23S ribosomal RNA methyltransferase Erm [Kroppenstedtia pulmonis]|uniref:rRNA adenine N-6-methyltransferase n=1 Tax=Kroppenstedtia pulmonis TaxID=1380685 RepID=A0A7D3XIZ0_9BACL|nr:23S ribosomal RNA methyltransferase Erm [Kroppenstedtia pulmonis]QKG84419.1 23S ribosomal RNA methyltransferase Erm [Kroppenstedtia pulmonis]